MKTKTKLVVGGMLLAAVVSSFGQPAIITQPQDQTNFRTRAILSVVLPAPFLVSASSVNATDIAVCFSAPLATGRRVRATNERDPLVGVAYSPRDGLAGSSELSTISPPKAR